MRKFEVGKSYTAPSVNSPVSRKDGPVFTVVKRTAKYITVKRDNGGERRLYIRTHRCVVGEDYEYAWLNEMFGWSLTS